MFVVLTDLAGGVMFLWTEDPLLSFEVVTLTRVNVKRERHCIIFKSKTSVT